MPIPDEDVLVQECKRLVENKLGWGSSDRWSTDDYNKLSELIEEATGVRLSVATLKRIWGRVKYENRPTVSTLNPLAKFVGFESWRKFELENTSSIDQSGNSTE